MALIFIFICFNISWLILLAIILGAPSELSQFEDFLRLVHLSSSYSTCSPDTHVSTPSAHRTYNKGKVMSVYLLNRLANVRLFVFFLEDNQRAKWPGYLSAACFDLLGLEMNWPSSWSDWSPQAVNPNNYGFIKLIVCVSGFLIKPLSYSPTLISRPMTIHPSACSKLIAYKFAQKIKSKKYVSHKWHKLCKD